MQVDYKGSVAPGKAHIGIRVIPGKTGAVMLRPGVNTLTPEQWASIAEHPTVMHLIDAGELVELKGKGEKGGDLPITAMSPMVAQDLVRRTTEPAVLEKWRDQLLAGKGGQVWQPVAELLAAQIKAVSTDANGNPAKQRPLQLVA